uniref:PRANC domain-containing protein n=1 Tax=Trichogramma kaykai TaxID=54128 RepID=A0ABD2XLA7_9HYME
MTSNDQKYLNKLKTCREEVNWEIKEERLNFLNQFYSLVENWDGQLPNLRDIFRTEEIGWLLTRDVENVCKSKLTLNTPLLLDFIIRCDHKDQPKVDEYGSPLLRRTTPLHIVARHEYSLLLHYITRDLFKIYNRFDVNYSDESGLTHFHVACKFACYDAVEKFLKFRQDPNCFVQTSVDPPMHLAVAEGHKQIVRLLLRSGADPNVADDEGSTSLHIMCNNYRANFMEIFFEICDEERKTVLVDARDSLGRTPLHLAVRDENEKLAELLLRRGADPNTADTDGWTPMLIMCRKGEDDEDDDEVDDDVVDVEDNYELLELFFKINDEIQQSVKVDARDSLGNTPLHLAVSDKKGYGRYRPKLRDVNEKIAKLLLKRGASPNLANSDGLTPLHIICQSYYNEEYNFVNIFFAICDEMHQTVQVDARDKLGRTPLHLALHLGYKKTAETLLRRGADQNLADAEGLTPLHIICERVFDADEDDYDCFIDVLVNFFKINDELHQTVLVDAQDNLGNTPMHWAVTRDNWSMIDLLLSRGANSNLADAEGLTPLHIMCKLRDYDYANAEEFFEINDELDHPVHVNTRNKKGQTPLHLALNCHGQEFIELLLRRGADHNLADNDGSTPLHIICQRKDGDNLLKIFFKFNCKLHETVDARDVVGRTPLHWAVASLLPDMVEFLLDSGASVSGFVFPTDAYIVKKNAKQDTLGTVVFHTMSIIESLEKRGYQLDQTTAISIMKIFAKHGLIDKTVDNVVECLCSDEDFTTIAKEKMVDPNLTLYDFLQLPPQKAEKLFTVKQYKDISKFFYHRRRFYQGFILFLCKRVTTRFFQGWAVELFMTLTRYQLPILCCDIIIRQLNLKDLCCIYLAAADPNLD